MPSSVSKTRVVPSASVTVTGAIWSLKRPSSMALAARAWESRPCWSISVRVMPYSSAISWAPVPWLNRMPS